MSELTGEQQRIVEEPRDVYVRACPGSGKTRTIVERYLYRAGTVPPNHALAVLSFTNTAVDDIVSRCRRSGTPELARYPHFLGTFDSFIIQYLVLPFGIPTFRGRLIVRESWDWLKPVHLRGAQSQGVSLDSLSIGEDGRAYLDDERVPREMRAMVARDRDNWQRRLLQERSRQHRRGTVSCDDARAIALSQIRQDSGERLGRALAARFTEVIVDEAQDCGHVEFEILEWLRRFGTSIVLVCDPDQSIYEFRRAYPERLKGFASHLKELPITGNWRSSKAICQFTATLRDDHRVDRAIGPNADRNEPIHLLVYKNRNFRAAGSFFTAHAQALGVPEEKCMILAHSADHAARAAGQPEVTEGSGGNGGALARALATLHNDPDPRRRVKALTTVQEIIVAIAGLYPGDTALPKLVAEYGIDEWLRRIAYTAACSLKNPANQPITEWLRHAQDVLLDIGIPGYDGAKPKSPRVILRVPKPSSARQLEAALRRDQASVLASTVHAAKGREYDAVLVIIPPEHAAHPTGEVLNAWQNRIESERKRVLYVAATRARYHLSIAVQDKHASQVEQILALGGVRYERKDLT